MVTCTYKSHVRSADRRGTWSFSQRGRSEGGGGVEGGQGGGSKGVKVGQGGLRGQRGGGVQEGECQREERKRFEKKEDFNEKSISKRVY